jgi:outer membrane lipoprotein SlyB
MKYLISAFSILIGLFSLSACTSMPTGPSVLVLPGAGKTFDQFRSEDYRCRQYAFSQIGGATPSQVSAVSGIGSAVTGTALGSAAGAAIGGGKGAAIGAGSGLIVGSMAGGEAAEASGYEAQSRYDMGYIQCMYSMGNRVPISGNLIDENALDEGSQPYTAPLPAPPTRR